MQPQPKKKHVFPGEGKRHRSGSAVVRQKCKEAYDHWVKNPYLLMVDVGLKFKVSPESLRGYIALNGLKRPDGRDYTKKSSRQLWIEKAYKKAVKEKLNARQAAAWVEKESEHNCNKGDIQYYAMKNDLPYLPDPPAIAVKTEEPVVPQLKGPGLP